MRHLIIASLALCNLGCAVGWGSAFVGEWVPRKEIEYRACLEDEQGRCLKKREEIGSHPERSFMGVVHSFPTTVGGAVVWRHGSTSRKFRVEPTLEVLRGRGPWAYGVRFGAAIDVDKTPVVMLPVTLQAHYAFARHFNMYAGGGWIPFSTHRGERSILGAQALVGARWSFAHVFRQTFYVLGVEASTTWVGFDQAYLSTGMTGYAGAFF